MINPFKINPERIKEQYSFIEKCKTDCFNKRECAVGNQYRRTLLSTGNTIDPIHMVVCNPPTIDQLNANSVFTGISGNYLRELLKLNGLTKKNTLITTLSPCCNKDARWESGREVLKTCKNLWVRSEMTLLKPKVILCLGELPLRYLFGSLEPVSSFSKKTIGRQNGYYIITYSPDFILQNKENKELVSEFENCFKRVKILGSNYEKKGK